MKKDDYLDVYKRYLTRFEQLFGDADFDAVVQFHGKLIQKLKYDEFVDKWTEFKKIENYLKDVMTKGATLNDEVNRSYAELSATVLENPKDFMLM